MDNGSSDGSAELVRGNYPEVRLLVLPENLGFAGGNNAGIRAASGLYIALLNNDTKTDPEWLATLARSAEGRPGIGMWASKILSFTDPDVIDNVGLLIYRDGLARGKGRLEHDRGQYDLQNEVLLPSGCAALYRKAMLDEIGLFDEAFFAYADDVDLGLRGRLAGWGCVFVPAAKVYHKYSASSSAYSPLKAFLVERNRIWVLLKYFPLTFIVLSPYYTFKRMLLHLYGGITGRGASGKFIAQHSGLKVAGVLIRAWWSAFSILIPIIRQRLDFKKKTRLSRSAFIQLLNQYGISASEIALKD